MTPAHPTQASEELPPIERDEAMDRTYIPLPGGWEVQTKGKGSSFRIANTQSGNRWLIVDKHLHELLERMARDIHAASRAAATAPGAPQREEVVMCNRCGGTGHVDDGYLTHSEGGIPYSEPIKRIKDCPACNGAGKAVSRAAATAPAGGVTEADERAWFESHYASRYGKLPITWNDATRMTRSPLDPLPAHMDGVYVMKEARDGWAAWKARAALTTAARAAEPDQQDRWSRVLMFAEKIIGLLDSKAAAASNISGIAADAGRRAVFIRTIAREALAARAAEPEGFYVASRASIPERPAMWQGLRLKGWPITSTWIDEAGEGETDDMGELWRRIHDEIQRSTGVLLYAEADDFPLKGALIECGIALGMGKPVAVVLPGVHLHPRSMKPLGSWAAHPLVTRYDTLEAARQALAASPTPPTGTSQEGGE